MSVLELPPAAQAGERPTHARRASASSASTARFATASACSNIRPAARLSEEELAQEFEISRTPVRRVLARLESEGLIEARHGVGTIVTDVEIEELAQVYHLRLELARAHRQARRRSRARPPTSTASAR